MTCALPLDLRAPPRRALVGITTVGIYSKQLASASTVGALVGVTTTLGIYSKQLASASTVGALVGVTTVGIYSKQLASASTVGVYRRHH